MPPARSRTFIDQSTDTGDLPCCLAYAKSVVSDSADPHLCVEPGPPTRR